MASVHIPKLVIHLVILVIYPHPFYLMPVVIFTGNTIHTETFHFLDFDEFWLKFFHDPTHIAIIRCSVLQSPINNRCVFVTSHSTIALKFTIGISFQIPSVGKRFHISVSPVIFRYIWEIHIMRSSSHFATHEFLNDRILLGYNLL